MIQEKINILPNLNLPPDNQQTKLFPFESLSANGRAHLPDAAKDTNQYIHSLKGAALEKYGTAILHREGTDIVPPPVDSVAEEAAIRVVNNDVLNVAQAMSAFGIRPCILNFANAHHPGGGWLGGAVAQEECIARRSSLVLSIEENPMYDRNSSDDTRNDLYYLDDMIFSPYVLVFKDERLSYLDEPFDISVVTAAAVNMRNLPHPNDKETLRTVDEVMRHRVDRVLDLMAYYKQRNIILGAWGCGAFGQDVRRVAKYFYDSLFDAGRARLFTNVIFAIYKDTQKLQVFREVFAEKLVSD